MVILTLYRKQLATINIMKTKLLMFAVLLITYFEVSAQKIYRTDDGHIEMMTLADSKSIKAESHNLVLYLDYDAANATPTKLIKNFLVHVRTIAVGMDGVSVFY